MHCSRCAVLTVGIDPGLTGAFAVLGAGGALVTVADLPIMRDRKLGWIDAEAFSSTLFGIANGERMQVTVERVHAMPRNGSQAAFSQGCTLGSVLAALQLVRARIELVQPAAWKKALGLSSDKSASLDKARLLYPLASLDRKKDHNRAEALLIAHYAQSRRAA